MRKRERERPLRAVRQTFTKLERQFLGFEMSEEYAKRINERLDGIKPGDPLVGPENSALSAPKTGHGRTLEEVNERKSAASEGTGIKLKERRLRRKSTTGDGLFAAAPEPQRVRA